MTFEGVGANLTDRNGYWLCAADSNPGTNFLTTWDMVFGNDGKGYAQSGTMVRAGYNCIKQWAEQSNFGVFNDYYLGGCSAAGSTHHYWHR